jgi:hypothetical protein
MDGGEATIKEQLDALKDTSEFAELLNTHGKTVLETNRGEIIGKAQGEAYGHLDTLAKEVLGIDKERNVKTTDLFKPLLEELKTLRENKGANSEDVEKALNAQKSEHENQVLTMKQAMEVLEQKNSELLTSGTKRDIKAAISKELQGKTFKAHYTEQDLQVLLSAKTNSAVNNGKVENGTIVFYNEDGTKRLNAKGLPITASELVQADYSDMYQVKKGGGGADPTASDPATIQGDKVVLNMTEIKTREQFYTAVNNLLAAQGLASHSEEYNKLYKEAMQEYSYNELPVK